MKRFSSLAMVLGVVVLLAACSSAVRLNDMPPVEDRSTGSTGSNNGSTEVKADADGTVVSKGAVQTVNLSPGSTPDAAVAALSRVIYFDYDSYVIGNEFQPIVEAQAKYLAADKNRKVVIEGHTDDRGGREYNLALGQKRAEAVRRALTLLGVSDSQLEAISYGKEKPAVTGGDEAARQKNRRAEISSR